jgi:hypothetical protein
MARAKVIDDGKECDYVWKDSVRNVITTRKEDNGRRSVGVHRAHFDTNGMHFIRCDPWVSGLLVLNVPGTVDYVPFEDLLGHCAKPAKCRKKEIDGKETIIATMVIATMVKDGKGNDFPPCEIEVRFDPSHNYLVNKAVYSWPGYTCEDTVAEFVEAAPGLYFPSRMSGKSDSEGRPYSESGTLFSEIRVNQPLPDDIFTLKYPDGAFVADDIRHTKYRVDPSGNRTSNETELARVQPLPSQSTSPEFTSESTEEQRSLHNWILPISLGILVVAAVIGYLRWRRGSRMSAEERP